MGRWRDRGTKTVRQIDKHRDGQTDIDRQIDRQMCRWRDRGTQTVRHGDKHRDGQT